MTDQLHTDLPQALRRALDLLAERPANPDVSKGYLDLLTDEFATNTPKNTGLIQAAWASGIGSMLYDNAQALARRVASVWQLPVDWLNIPSGGVALDVGSGPGNVTAQLGQATGPDGLALGLDISEPMLARAVQAQAGPNVGFMRADAQRLPLRDETVDATTSLAVLQLIPNPAQTLAEMVRVLKPGGDFLFMAPKGEHGRAGFALKRVLGFTADQEGFGHARDGYPLDKARALMQRHGLTVRSVNSYCRLFTESLEDLLNYAYHRKAMKQKQPSEQDFHGDTAPMSAEALNKVGTAYKVYSTIYPALRAWTLLDRLIPFSPGYMMVARASKAA